MGRIIAIANQKGGSGKTTTTVNLAAALVKRAEKVLIVDMDPQAHCSKTLGFKLTHEDISIVDIMRTPEQGIERNIRPTALDDLHLAPSHINLSQVETELASEIGPARILREALHDVVSNYDHIIIDCQPSLGILVLNCLLAADEVIIPMEAEPLALDGMAALEQTIAKTRSRLANDIEVLGVLVTKFRRGTKLHEGLLEELREYWQQKVFNTVIHINIAAAEAVLDGIPVVIASPEATSAQDYVCLAEEVLERESEFQGLDQK